MSCPPDGHPAAAGGALVLGGVAWSWAYSLSGPHGPAGYLVVGAEGRPAESERFLLRVLAQQTGVVLANARLHHRERERAAELVAAHRALLRSVEIHDRLTRVAAGGEGQQGIARARQTAMYLTRKITGLSYPAIGERFGGKDHSTVINAEQRITQLMDEDTELRATVESLLRRLNG